MPCFSVGVSHCSSIADVNCFSFINREPTWITVSAAAIWCRSDQVSWATWIHWSAGNLLACCVHFACFRIHCASACGASITIRTPCLTNLKIKRFYCVFRNVNSIYRKTRVDFTSLVWSFNLTESCRFG